MNSACAQWNATTSACEGDAWTYTYDGAGNLLRFDQWSGGAITTTRFVYNGANQIECIDADASGVCDGTEFVYQYDAYGNLLSDGSSTYIYDAALQLSSVITGEGATTYQYNGDGDRVAQTVNGVQTTYVIDTATPLTMVLAETTGTDTIRYLHGLDLVAQSDGVSTEYFAYDGLGSVRRVLDSAGTPLLTQTFDPYGNPYASTGINESNWGYTGEYQDSNGLVFLRARYYDPKQGRFFQRDSWRGEPDHPLTLNPYMYGLGNPLLYVDPTGHFAIPLVMVIEIAAVVVVVSVAVYLLYAALPPEIQAQIGQGITEAIGLCGSVVQGSKNMFAEDHPIAVMLATFVSQAYQIQLQNLANLVQASGYDNVPVPNLSFPSPEQFGRVEEHLKGFIDPLEPAEKAMLERLQNGSWTDWDKRFFEHEWKELQLMEELMEQGLDRLEAYDKAHRQVLEEQGLSADDPEYEAYIYHPDVVHKYREYFNSLAQKLAELMREELMRETGDDE